MSRLPADPLADFVTLEFEATIETVFVDQPQRPFGVVRDDDARHALAGRICEALVALPEVRDVAVAFAMRGGGRAVRGMTEAPTLGAGGPFDEPLPPGDPA